MRPHSARPIVITLVALAGAAALAAQTIPATTFVPPAPNAMFEHSDRCQVCHNGMKTPSGAEFSIGTEWRTTMMANAARDPYWHGAVRRESTDYPAAQAAIEAECSKCHMPAARLEAHAIGREGEVFVNIPQPAAPGVLIPRTQRLAADGVSCTVCHQIAPQKLGTREHMGGNLIVDSKAPWGQRKEYGQFDVDPGRARLMHSTIGFTPEKSAHISSSELCASCHTLYTRSLAPGADPNVELPEQVPYQEWLHSEFKTTKSCQNCHMPKIDEPVALSSSMGIPRTGVSRHTFVGGDTLMPRIFAKFGAELGVDPAATPAEFEARAKQQLQHLQSAAATLAVEDVSTSGDAVSFVVNVQNAGGHKLPTAYPSRRVWLHVDVRDASGAVVFESGAVRANGSIVGNDNDDRDGAIEPHHAEITNADQVQIYEAVMVTPKGVATTGLLSGVKFGKDNRLLPRGFDKATAPWDVAVHGAAADDADFTAGGDRVRYAVPTKGARGPLTIRAELRFQTIGYRWAENLRQYNKPEPQRFIRFFDAFAAESSVMLVEARATTR